MTSTAKIRPAVKDDASAIAACVHAAYSPYIERMGQPPGPMLDNYAEVIARHAVFVAEDGAMQGILVLIEEDGGILLDNIAVAPAAQGTGVGRALLEFAEAEARRRGYGAITLYTHELMVENIALYQKIGYRETGRRHEKGFARVYMRKPLDDRN
jgi:GNAT superfamily N-acetyltransferase